MLLGSVYRCGGAPETTLDALEARLPSPTARTRPARAHSWHLVSVCLSTPLPPRGDSWTEGGVGGTRGARDARSAPSL